MISQNQRLKSSSPSYALEWIHTFNLSAKKVSVKRIETPEITGSGKREGKDDQSEAELRSLLDEMLGRSNSSYEVRDLANIKSSYLGEFKHTLT